MKHHSIKLSEFFAEDVLSGRKTFEVRENDRGYQTGDTVSFKVVRKDGTQVINHPLHEKKYEITYVLSGWGIEKGYVVFGFRPVNEERS